MTTGVQVAPSQPPPIARDETRSSDAETTSGFGFGSDSFGNSGDWAFGAAGDSGFNLAYVSVCM